MLTNQPRVTMRQIAACFGVSHATVSLALRNHPRISLELRKKIQEKAVEMGYQPDPLLTVLAHYRHSRLQTPMQAAIAWLNCWRSPKELRSLREFNAYWEGAAEAAQKFGYHLEEFIVDQNMPLTRLEKILLTRNIKGIIIPPHREPPNWDGFNWNNFSAVRLGRTVQSPQMHVITSDQTANTMLAFGEIRQKGYDRIGYVGGEVTGWMFTAGFMQAQLALPKALRVPPLLMAGQYEHPKNRLLLLSWLKKYKPRAIITNLPEIPALLKSLDYRVPDDVALAGLSQIDGNISAGIDQHSNEVGRVALLTVISLINDFAQGVPPIFRQILVEGSWVEGASMPSLRKTGSEEEKISRRQGNSRAKRSTTVPALSK